ncbi:MAG: magnesium chelatase subunit D family protein [Dissulfurimicrobium sp.]|uniref:magnesium chelatase subunit D family protein n=1 Tax=Dissulfurimicrobium sp. TaxID=2022436 RepID=UPI00404AD9D7
MLNVVNPKIGGVLIRGEKGTAKSTAVRALAALLPEISVVAGCPYSCDPDDREGMCDDCRKRPLSDRRIRRQRVRVVTLPLNATEDRVAGGIDFNMAVRQGVRAVLPGLLAEANRSILYVDEVNLLDDHIVDIILDAAASGENRIEREGISFMHPASFILVGTMNPEEGGLRPQLLDRFGLCVDVTAEADVVKRVELMERREAFDRDPEGFLKRFEEEERRVAEQIAAARESLRGIRCPRHLRTFISELCTKNLVAGHRADLVMEQAARAHAAICGRLEVTTEDIAKVAPFVLAHRTRDAQPPLPPQLDRPEENRTEDTNTDTNETEQDSQPETERPDDGQDAQPERGPNEEPSTSGEQSSDADKSDDAGQPEEKGPSEQIFEVGTTFAVKKIVSPKDRVFRRGSGRRSRTRVSLKRGRYIKSISGDKNSDIALDATLRAAAPYQLARKKDGGPVVVLKKEDLRAKIREKRIGNFILFLVDASGSMGASGRMVASKGAIMSLLLDVYQKRDRVAMVSFRKDRAVVNLPPTASVELAGKLLSEMPVGGKTPLSAGLAAAYELVRGYLLRDPTARPIVIIITDGKSNVAMGNRKPIEEALEFAGKMAADSRVMYIVVDTEKPGFVNFGLAGRLAEALNARYLKIEGLRADQLVNIIKEYNNEKH